METVIKYKAFDGREFFEREEAAEHETNLTEAQEIMAKLPAKPEGCDFTNGRGYIQHDNSVLDVKIEFLEFVKRYTDHHWIQQTIDDETVHSSYASRIIGECAPNSIDRMWTRFTCMDNRLREWGQPFYADNPDKAQQVKLN